MCSLVFHFPLHSTLACSQLLQQVRPPSGSPSPTTSHMLLPVPQHSPPDLTAQAAPSHSLIILDLTSSKKSSVLITHRSISSSYIYICIFFHPPFIFSKYIELPEMILLAWLLISPCIVWPRCPETGVTHECPPCDSHPHLPVQRPYKVALEKPDPVGCRHTTWVS